MINDRGYDTHLYNLLSDHLETLDTLILSTHTIAPSDDPSHFLSDGHFTHAANQAIGKELSRMIRAEIKK